MSELMQMDCYDKYTWIFDEATAMLICKRNGQDWRNETGDGAILALLQTACETRDALQAENAQLRDALADIAKQHIGNEIEEPDPEYDYAYEAIVKVARAALEATKEPS